jgi:hypothetical protein
VRLTKIKRLLGTLATSHQQVAIGSSVTHSRCLIYARDLLGDAGSEEMVMMKESGGLRKKQAGVLKRISWG